MQNPPKGARTSFASRHEPPAHTEPGTGKLAALTEALRVLESLNDPELAPALLADTVAQMPTLCARTAREYRRLFAGREIPSLGEQLASLGRRRFQHVLFNYLEELTRTYGDEL